MNNSVKNIFKYLFFVVVLALIIGAVVYVVKVTNNFTKLPQNYVEVNGAKVTSETVMEAREDISITVRSPLGNRLSFTAKVYANTDDTHNFSYEVNGSTYDFAGTDLTSAVNYETTTTGLVFNPIALDAALAKLHDVETAAIAGLSDLDFTYPWVKIVLGVEGAEDLTLLVKVNLGISKVELDKTEVII